MRLPLDEATVRALVPLLKREQVESISPSACCTPSSILLRSNKAHAAPSSPEPNCRWRRSRVCFPARFRRKCGSGSVFHTHRRQVAYVQPLMARYLKLLETAPARAGHDRARLPRTDRAVAPTDQTATSVPLPHPPCGKRAGGRCHFLRPCRAAMRPGQRAVLRHGRHHRKNLPDRRLQTANRPHLRGRPPVKARFRKGSLALPLLRIPVIEMVEIGAAATRSRRGRDGAHRRRPVAQRRRRPGPAC